MLSQSDFIRCINQCGVKKRDTKHTKKTVDDLVIRNRPTKNSHQPFIPRLRLSRLNRKYRNPLRKSKSEKNVHVLCTDRRHYKFNNNFVRPKKSSRREKKFPKKFLHDKNINTFSKDLEIPQKNVESLNELTSQLRNEILVKNSVIDDLQSEINKNRDQQIKKDRELMTKMFEKQEEMITGFQESGVQISQSQQTCANELEILRKSIDLMKDSREVVSLKNTIEGLETRLQELSHQLIKREKKEYSVRKLEEKFEEKENERANMSKKHRLEIEKRDDEIYDLKNEVEKVKGKFVSLQKENKKRKLEELQIMENNEKFVCGICLDRDISVSFGCGHCVCDSCADVLKKCPFDRKKINKRIHLYV